MHYETTVPTVLDRVVQQAVQQVLQKQWDPTFSEHSYGFRPGRSAHQAVAQAQQYIAEGYGWCVDFDLEKFFDRVNHDRLMGAIAKRVEDKRLLKLIRAFLNAGGMEGGLVSPSVEGTPQGGPISPLLSNLVLDELDRELERRGHRFVRYADDSKGGAAGDGEREAIHHRKAKAQGERVEKCGGETAGAEVPWAKPPLKEYARNKRYLLGFSFTGGKELKRKIAPKAIDRFKERIREITHKARGQSMEQVMEELARYLRGWRGYFGFCETPSVLQRLDSWVRRRVRCAFWRQWKTGRKRFAELVRRGVREDLAATTAGSRRGPWHVSQSPALGIALSNAALTSFGLPSLVEGR